MKKIILTPEAVKSLVETRYCVAELPHDEPKKGEILHAEVNGQDVGLSVVTVQQGAPGSRSHVRLVILGM